MSGLGVAVIAFDGISPFHLSAPCVVFGEGAGAAIGCRLTVCAVRPGRIRSSAGFDLVIDAGLDALDDADIVIVPSWPAPSPVPGPFHTPPPDLCAALVRAHGQGRLVVGLCLGAYVLAEAGLLDGRRATTHWAYADDFAHRYPLVRVDDRVLYVEEPGVVTAAGTTAALDCCLALLRQRYGGALANSVARRLVMAPHRQGGQAQYIERPMPQNRRDTRLSGVLDWMRDHLDQSHGLDGLARRAGLSRSTFTRHFRDLTGMSVVEWLTAQRLALAQHLLEHSDHGMEDIAEAAGFGSTASLRHHFQARFGVSPRQWRHSFAG